MGINNIDELKVLLNDRLDVTLVTNEDVYDYLGISRPAFNRWKNGASMPYPLTLYLKGIRDGSVTKVTSCKESYTEKTYTVGQMQALANEIKRLKAKGPDSNLVKLWEAWKSKNDIKGTFVATDDIRRFLEHITGS